MSPPTRRRAPARALPTIANASRDQGQGNRASLVGTASWAELAIALMEPSPFAAAYCGDEVVPCPRCQRQTWVLHAPAAHIIGDVLVCVQCVRVTTRWHAEALVRLNHEALQRLADLIGTAA